MGEKCCAVYHMTVDGLLLDLSFDDEVAIRG